MIRSTLSRASTTAQRLVPRTLSTTTTINNINNNNTDRLLVIGSGVAGSATALLAAELYQIPVTLLYAGTSLVDCNSYWAQGGIIYRNYNPSSQDSVASLMADIHRAGAGLCRDDAVAKVAHEGPDRVRQLLLNQTFCHVPFDRNNDNDEYSLCLEASHSAPRILHKADHTGAVITQHLTAAVQRQDLITTAGNTVVTDLIVRDDMILGCVTLDRTTGQQAYEYAKAGTVLCAGGLAGIYQSSTNPVGFNALGSSVAAATRAGAVTQDLEYVQFHPTALCATNSGQRFLLTEALRGEGGILRDAQGRAFARDYHPDGELAPRDVVARGVFTETQKTEQHHNAFLDMTHRDANFLHQRFPSIQQHIHKNYNLDLARDPLPVIPAAHYTCGGIVTDLHGRTNMPGLFAAGEAARTGLHGGNRLASTSLLEGLVFGAAVADYCGSTAGQQLQQELSERIAREQHERHEQQWHERRTPVEPAHIESAAHGAMKYLQQVRRIMWDYVGVVRTVRGLETAVEELRAVQRRVDHLYATCPTLETAAVRDAACAGLAVARAALANGTSRGAHYVVPEDESDEEEEAAAAVAR